MDDAVARAQRNTTARADEVGQLVVHGHVDRLRIGRGMAERLHDQVGAETEAGEILELVAGHRASGVLRSDRGHARLAIGAGTHALPLWQATGAPHHFLREAEALAAAGRIFRQAEQGRGRQSKRLACPGGQAATDDQRNAATGADLVEQHFRLDPEFGDQLAILECLALIWAQFDNVAHRHLADIELDRQRTGVFHGVVEDRRDLAAEADAAEALVRDVGDILAGEPEHRVGRRLAARTGTDHIADVGDQMALLLERFDERNRTALAVFFRGDAVAPVLEHGQRVQRDIGAGRRIGRRREVIGIGFAADFEHRDRQRLRNLGSAREPFAVGPALQHAAGMRVALVGLLLDVVEGIEHEQGLLQCCRGTGAQRGVIEQFDQRMNVVATEHGAEQFGCPLR